MNSKKGRSSSDAKVAALEAIVEERHNENIRRFDALTEQVTKVEASVEKVETSVDAVAKDVRSLLESRAFSLGVWKAVATTGGIIGGLIALASFLRSWFFK